MPWRPLKRNLEKANAANVVNERVKTVETVEMINEFFSQVKKEVAVLKK